MKSQAQPTSDYRIISLSCARLRVRGPRPRETVDPGHGYPASGLVVTCASRPRGGPAGARSSLGRRNGRSAGLEGGSRLWRRRLGARGAHLEGPRAAPGKAAPQAGRGGAPPAAPARRSPPGGQRGGARGSGRSPRR